jgi:hypothetical protein
MTDRTIDATRRRVLALGGALSLGSLTPLLQACGSVATQPHALAPGALGSPAPLPALPTELLLDDLAQRSFRYFWETTDPRTGLVPDRWPTPSFASVAAVGFGLTALCIGVERGWITRAQGRERALVTLQFLHDAPQGPQARGVAGYKGFFYHFLDMARGTRYGRCELSTVDTALCLAGALHAQQFFDGNDEAEVRLRMLAETIYARVDWRWAQARAPRIALGWHPETGFIPGDWKGYNESMIVYLLALGSPTHPVEPQAWEAWCSTYDQASWGTDHGITYLRFPPLFGHQFSHLWVDYRGILDPYMRAKGFDYFENSRRATYAQRAHGIANPQGWAGYGPEVWGITASDGPADVERVFGGVKRRFISYAGRGMAEHDDGTVAAYGAGSSIPFAPEIAIPAVAAMRERFGAAIYGRYGFFAFNPSFTFTDVKLLHGRIVPGLGWVDTDFLGIEVGPLLGMLANHASGSVWSAMRRQPQLRQGLRRAGFAGGWLEQA